MIATPARWRANGQSAVPIVAVATVVAATAAGALVAHGSHKASLLIAVISVAAIAVVIADHVYEVLIGWIALEALAFPFVRYPLNHNLATFDRTAILAMGGAMLIKSWPKMSVRTKRLTQVFGLFALIYGLRAITSAQLPLPQGYLPSASYQPELDWLDNIAMAFIVFVVAARTITPGRWPAVARALTVLGVTAAAFALLEWALGFQLSTIEGYSPFVDTLAGVVRSGGPYPDPTVYGAVMVVAIAATLYWIQVEKAYVLGSLALAIELLGLAPSFTKTVWGAGFVTVVIALGLRRRFSSRTLLVSFYSATAIGIIYTLVQNSSVIQARVTSQASADNFTGRLAAWHQGLLIFDHWPIFGAGVDQFIGAQQVIGPIYQNGVKAVPSPHNAYISALAETGLVGFLPLLLVLALSFMVVRAVRRRARSTEEVVFGATLVAAFAGLFLLSMTFGLLYEAPSTIFFALLMGTAAARLDAAERGPRRPAAARPALRS